MGMHHLPDTSPGSSNHCGIMRDPSAPLLNAYNCESVVLWSSSSGFLRILAAEYSPRSCLDPYRDYLSEWMDGEQHTWRTAVTCIDAFVIYTWLHMAPNFMGQSKIHVDTSRYINAVYNHAKKSPGVQMEACNRNHTFFGFVKWHRYV